MILDVFQTVQIHLYYFFPILTGSLKKFTRFIEGKFVVFLVYVIIITYLTHQIEENKASTDERGFIL